MNPTAALLYFQLLVAAVALISLDTETEPTVRVHVLRLLTAGET